MNTMQERKNERRIKAHAKMEYVLLVEVQNHFPQATFNDGVIHVPFEVEGEATTINARIERVDYDKSYSMYSSKMAIRVGYFGNTNYESDKYFNKRFGGKRLKTDILDENFKVQKILDALTMLKDYRTEQEVARNKRNESLEKKKNVLDNLNKELFNGEGNAYDWRCEVSGKGVTVRPGFNNEKVVTLKTNAISLEKAKRIIDIINEDV